jgi:hypothetical protein
MRSPSVVRYVPHYYALKRLFTTNRDMVKWFLRNRPREGSNVLVARLWTVIREEIDARRVKVPKDLREEVAGVMLAYRLEHPVEP